ncbi:hypothetical protein DOZ80_04410 [Pseudomonas fluorescens]|uniref:Uncharacterized protein n=1 Tax=Pseudomonas fluorescens TaxID=294 RepID=A0A327NFF3_PSEFL|nr:hypothetical protein DOZ80_04410 [Pseudomonas fluorescens]
MCLLLNVIGGSLLNPVEAGLLAKAACLLLIVDISVAAVTAAGGFALTASPFGKRPKGTKGLAPNVRPLAKARGSFAPAFLRGHCPPVGCARPTCNGFDCVERRCAPIPG